MKSKSTIKKMKRLIFFALTLLLMLPILVHAESEVDDFKGVTLNVENIIEKSDTKVRAMVKAGNNSGTDYIDMFASAELYLDLEGRSSLVSRAIYPITLKGNAEKEFITSNIMSQPLTTGKYSLIVRLYNKTGLPVTSKYMDLNEMGSDQSFVVFLPDKTSLDLNGRPVPSDSGPLYPANSSPTFSATVKNISSKSFTGQAVIHIYKRMNNGSAEPILKTTGETYRLAGGEQRDISFNLPKMTTPDAYYAEIFMQTQDNIICSAIAIARYIIEGPSAKIISTNLLTTAGKNEFQVEVSGSADGSELRGATIKLTVSGKSAGADKDIQEKTVTLKSELSTLKLPINLPDSDNKEFSIQTEVAYNNEVLDKAVSDFEIQLGQITAVPKQNVGTGAQTNVPEMYLTDIKNTPFEDGVQTLIDKNFVKGYADGTFKPYSNITRAEFATLMSHLLNRHTEADKFKNDKNFNDTDSSHWANGFINIARDAGLMTGYPDGNFYPNQNITYAEVLTVVVKIANNGAKINDSEPWPYNFYQEALALNLLDNVEHELRSPAIRGNIVLIVVNALKLKP